MAIKTKLDLSRYHYRYDPNNPEIHPYYLQYKAMLKIPVWCPLSDEEREGFEIWYPEQIKQKQKRNPSDAENA